MRQSTDLDKLISVHPDRNPTLLIRRDTIVQSRQKMCHFAKITPDLNYETDSINSSFGPSRRAEHLGKLNWSEICEWIMEYSVPSLTP